MPNEHGELVIAVGEGFRMGCRCRLSPGDLTDQEYADGQQFK